MYVLHVSPLVLSCYSPSSILLVKKEGMTFGVIQGAPLHLLIDGSKRVLLRLFHHRIYIPPFSHHKVIEQQSWLFPKSILCLLSPRLQRSMPLIWDKHRSSGFFISIELPQFLNKLSLLKLFLFKFAASSPIDKKFLQSSNKKCVFMFWDEFLQFEFPSWSSSLVKCCCNQEQ